MHPNILYIRLSELNVHVLLPVNIRAVVFATEKITWPKMVDIKPMTAIEDSEIQLCITFNARRLTRYAMFWIADP